MASKRCHSHFAGSAEGNRPPFTQPIQPSNELLMIHHYVPENSERGYKKDNYQLKDHKRDNQGQRQDLPHEHQYQDWQLHHLHHQQHQQHEHQYQDPQSYHHHHQQQQQPQQSLNHEYGSQFQLAACAPQIQNSAPANLPPAVPQALHVHVQSWEQAYSLRSISQDQNDKKTPVPHQCEPDDHQSAISSSISPAPYPFRLGDHHENRSQNLEDSLSPQRENRTFSGQHERKSVERGPHPPDPYRSTANKPQTLNEVVKNPEKQRVATACDRCRDRKRKCSGENPCSHCHRDGTACKYHKTASVITKKNAEGDDPTLGQIKNMVQKLLDRSSDEVQCGKPPERICDSASLATSTVLLGPRETSYPPFQDEHRMGPHRLVGSWPVIAELLERSRVQVDDRDYVMDAEERSPLCLYPKDEEADNWVDAQTGELEGFMNHDNSVKGNALPISTEYCSYGPSAGRSEGCGVRLQRHRADWGSSIDKAPSDAVTVEALYQSYMKHIHVMQPFLDVGRVRDLLEDFVAWQKVPSQPSVAADHYRPTSGRPSKRRCHDNRPNIPHLQRPRRARSLDHAVIYLILALGKICMHSDPLPTDSPSIGRSETPLSSLGRTYGAESSSPSLDNADTISRVNSQALSADPGSHGEGVATTRKVPGLDFYVKAVEIFGAYSDGNDLIHAQLFLLAGLYKGQLARVKESMSWYTMAGRILRQLLRSHGLQDKNHWTWTGKTLEARSQKIITDERRSLIVLASYSCIQLESDILAELDLPSSGIVSLETMLPMPGTFPGVSSSQDDPEQSANILFHFTSQVYLRVRLNQIHKQLYGPDCEGLSLAETRCILQEHEAVIEKWQKKLPAGMSWNLEDPPPTDILHARLRAKYWGARYLINRPFLDYILHIKPHPRLTVDEVASDSHRKPRREAEFHLFRAISEMSEEEVQIGYRTCIKAAEKSTIAFDNVLGRPIVTNIHGTAHAQFGNVLVLCGVYWHPDLCQLVNEINLRHLLSRTISFLDKLAPISPTCRADCLILEEVQRLIFGIPC